MTYLYLLVKSIGARSRTAQTPEKHIKRIPCLRCKNFKYWNPVQNKNSRTPSEKCLRFEQQKQERHEHCHYIIAVESIG